MKNVPSVTVLSILQTTAFLVWPARLESTSSTQPASTSGSQLLTNQHVHYARLRSDVIPVSCVSTWRQRDACSTPVGSMFGLLIQWFLDFGMQYRTEQMDLFLWKRQIDYPYTTAEEDRNCRCIFFFFLVWCTSKMHMLQTKMILRLAKLCRRASKPAIVSYLLKAWSLIVVCEVIIYVFYSFFILVFLTYDLSLCQVWKILSILVAAGT